MLGQLTRRPGIDRGSALLVAVRLAMMASASPSKIGQGLRTVKGIILPSCQTLTGLSGQDLFHPQFDPWSLTLVSLLDINIRRAWLAALEEGKPKRK